MVQHLRSHTPDGREGGTAMRRIYWDFVRMRESYELASLGGCCHVSQVWRAERESSQECVRVTQCQH